MNAESTESKKKMGIGTKMLIAVAVIVFLAVITKKDNPMKPAPAAAVQSVSKDSLPETEEVEAFETWQYSEVEDKMSNQPVKLAWVTATEELDFEFPYNGGSTVTFTIRKQEKGTVILP